MTQGKACSEDSNYEFDIQKELVSYCRNEVNILVSADVTFSKIIEERKKGIKYFLASATIASLAMRVFRALYLEKGTIVILPPIGISAPRPPN